MDASAYLASCLPEEAEERQARSLLDDHAHGKIQLHAQHLLAVQVLNGLYKRVRSPETNPARITPEEADAAWKLFQGVGIMLHEVGERGVRVLELTRFHQWPATYDMVYVALAEQLETILVTADPRLCQLSAKLPFIGPLGKYERGA